jgi:hypothetical protein
MLVEALDDASAGASGFDELLDAGIADADQGELGSCEKRIRGHQKKDQEHAEQHESDHLGELLMGNSSIPRGWQRVRCRAKVFNHRGHPSTALRASSGAQGKTFACLGYLFSTRTV